MDTINVLHICDYAAAYRGNFIDSLEALEKHQDNIKNFYLFPARARQAPAEEWIKHLNTKDEVAYIQEKNFFKNIILFLNIIKTKKIDRIVRHFSDFRIDIIIKTFFDGQKVVRFFHCDCNRSANPVKHRIKEFVWKNNRLVGVSESIANKIRTVHPDFQVYSIVNAIRFDRLDSIDEFSRENSTALLMMGWDYERKGVDLAIKAVRNLREKYDIVLQIVGGKNEDKIKQLAKNILGSEVDWIRYLPPTNNIGTYYRASDIFLSPSRQEAFGYANIEAAYCKNSIVLSKVDGQGQLNIEGAYWVEPDNVEDLTRQLEAAILELKLPERIAQKERTKEQVRQAYSLEEWAKKLSAVL